MGQTLLLKGEPNCWGKSDHALLKTSFSLAFHITLCKCQSSQWTIVLKKVAPCNLCILLSYFSHSIVLLFHHVSMTWAFGGWFNFFKDSLIYLFKSQSYRQGDMQRSSIHWFTPQMIANTRVRPEQSQKLHSGLPRKWEGPNSWSHLPLLFPGHWYWALSEVEQSDMNWYLYGMLAF